MRLVKENEDGSRPGYRGEDAYGDKSKSRQATVSRAATSSGNSGRERGAESNRSQSIPIPNPPPINVIRTDPMDIKEQARLGNTTSKIGTVMYETPDKTKVGPGSTMDDNRIDALNLAGE